MSFADRYFCCIPLCAEDAKAVCFSEVAGDALSTNEISLLSLSAVGTASFIDSSFIGSSFVIFSLSVYSLFTDSFSAVIGSEPILMLVVVWALTFELFLRAIAS